MRDETRNWLNYAKENLDSASILLDSKLFNPCLQNIQQAIEKYLKALLLENNQKIRKTHSIRELHRMLEDVDIYVGMTDEECDLLDAVYLPSKYPLGGVLPDFDPDFDLCTNCLNIVQKVEKTVRELLSS